MEMQGKIIKGKAIDMPQFNRSGWQLIPHKAFRNVAPDVLANMQPLPEIEKK